MDASRRSSTMGGLALCLLLAGCAGSGEGLDANGRPLDEGGGGTVPLTPDLASIQANVFTPVCAPCHSGAGAPQGLQLDAENSYAALVGVPSSEVPGLLRVEPGEPDSSYLVQKLEGRASVGARMPLGQPALPEATILVIRQWIQDGALPDSAGSAAALSPFAVKAVSASASVIAVAFDRPPDASLVSPATVELRAAASPATSPAIGTVLEVSRHNDSLLLIEPAAPLAPGSYELTLRGSGPVALADWSAGVLDGDGDGRPGGDHVATFDIVEAP
ncbi:MAG TPA: hypothetical protein VFI92_04595 [Steroidobacteraceae bacterium]|nr:hypothetical protein [Steroidobacteraceae bacterium]